MLVELLPGQIQIRDVSIKRPEEIILSKLFVQHDILVGKTHPKFSPDILLPYSISTFVAGALAGCFTREQAFEYAFKRADIVRKTESLKQPEDKTAMAIIVGNGDLAGKLADQFGLRWTNDNLSVHVLAGKIRDLEAMAVEVGVRLMGFLTAEAEYHSLERDQDSAKFADYLSNKQFCDPKINIISSTNPRLLSSGEMVKEELWQLMTTRVVLKDILKEAARFTLGEQDAGLEDFRNNIFIDISPESTMKKLISRMGFDVLDLADKRLEALKLSKLA